MTYDREEVVSALTQHTAKQFAVSFCLQLGLAAAAEPELVREAVYGACGIAGLEDRLKRLASTLRAAEQRLYEAGELQDQIERGFERIESRLDGYDAWLAATEDRAAVSRRGVPAGTQAPERRVAS